MTTIANLPGSQSGSFQCYNRFRISWHYRVDQVTLFVTDRRSHHRDLLTVAWAVAQFVEHFWNHDRLRGYLSGLAGRGQDLDVPIRSMHADPLPIPDQPGGMLHPHDGRQAVLPCDHRAMGHKAP